MIAAERGWQLLLHPDGAFAGEVRLPDGASRYFVRSTYDLNSAGAAKVALDKGLTKFFLHEKGFPVIEGQTFFSDRLCAETGSRRDSHAAVQYATSIGFPVMVKANSGGGGEGIERASDAAEVEQALARAFAFGDVVLIESYLEGLRDYRLLVLDREVLLAYERRPFAVVGDGISTVAELVDEFRRTAIVRGSGTPDFDRLQRSLVRAGVTETDVLEPGVLLAPIEVANLSQGGSAVEVTNAVHPNIARLAVDAARAIGLRYAGVDILSDDATRETSVAYILEVNASPTIHQFAALCHPAEERLIALHRKILDALAGAA